MAAWLVGRSASAAAGFATSLWIATRLLLLGAALYLLIWWWYPAPKSPQVGGG